VCDADNITDELVNVRGITTNGYTFFNNNDYGFFCNHEQNYSVSNCSAHGNGKTVASGSGMKLRKLTGSSTFTNFTADNNHCPGV
jgi:hypothetical protein